MQRQPNRVRAFAASDVERATGLKSSHLAHQRSVGPAAPHLLNAGVPLIPLRCAVAYQVVVFGCGEVIITFGPAVGAVGAVLRACARAVFYGRAVVRMLPGSRVRHQHRVAQQSSSGASPVVTVVL